MKNLKDIILEKLRISSNTKRSNSYSIADFIGDIDVQEIKHINSSFDNGVLNARHYLNVVNHGDVIAIIEHVEKMYYRVIVSPESYELIMGKPYDRNCHQEPTLPHRIETEIANVIEFPMLTFEPIIMSSDVFIETAAKTYDFDEKDEYEKMLEYIQKTLE